MTEVTNSPDTTPASSNSAEASEAAGTPVETTGSEGSATETNAAADALAQLQAESTKLKEQLLRTAADFDNFRKRSRREAQDAEKKGRDELLNELLPVFDNLERALSHSSAQAGADKSEADLRGLTDGLELVLKQFLDTLNRQGLEKVPGVGSPFDPQVHEAIQQLESADFEPGSIMAVVQTGYRQGERLIRPALVVVAKAKSAEA